MFVQVSPESIVAAGDTIGVANIPGNVTRALAEDVSYRTREVASLAALLLRHGRKRKLSVDDMNRALKWSDVGQVLGQGAETVSVGSIYHPVGQTSDNDLFIEADRELDLVSGCCEDKPILEQEQRLHITASWLHVEGSCEVAGGLTGHMLAYYNAVITATMSDNELVCSAMMRDVSSNPKISPILTYLITFIRHVMKRVSSRLKLQSRMLRLVSALFSNPHLNLTPKPYLSHLITAVLEKVCKDLVTVTHITTASSILGLALSRWATPVNQLKCQTVKHLRDVITSPVDKGLAQYGAVTCLRMLGAEMLCDSVHPWPAMIWSHLDTLTGAPLTNVSGLQVSAFREAGAALLNHWLVDTTSHCTPYWQLYGRLYDYFAHSLVPLIQPLWRPNLVKKTQESVLGRMRLVKVRVLTQSRAREGDESLTASQNFDFFADLGVPSDIFDEPVSSLDMMESQAAEQKRPQYSQQTSRTLSRSVKQLFPESVAVKKKGLVVKLPGMTPSRKERANQSSVLSISANQRPHCVPWRHLVSGGRPGAKYRKLEGNRIDQIQSYIDILVNM